MQLNNIRVLPFIVLFFQCLCTLGFAQPNSNEGFVLIDGLVSGYYYEPTRKLLQKERAVVLEGTLERVMMNVFESGALLHTVYTNKKGEFNFKLPLGKFYKIELTKNGRAKTVFLVDVQSVSNEIMVIGLRFNGAEIAMNRFVSKDTADANLPIGRLYFDSRKQMMEFEVNQPKNKGGLFSKRDETNPCISVMKRTVLKNKDNVATDEKAMEEYIKQAVKQKIDKLTGKGKKKSKFDATRKKEENNSAADSVNNISNVQKSRLIDLDPDIRLFTEGDISSRERAINAARKQLEKDKANAVSMEDSLIILKRERLLDAAMQELNNAKQLIEIQKKEISIQRWVLVLTVCCVLLLGGFLFNLYRHSKEKYRTHLLLKEQTKKITDSINYAQHIQQSILPQEIEIKNLLPESFIYFKPRDVVSGDFYWLSEVDNKIIIAVVDCTGHGVPGAFMSLIGNTLLNEIINEKQITEPSSILKQLHLGVLKSLRQESSEVNCQDGMEMSICVIDNSKQKIEFAGAMNPVYVVKNKELTIIKPDIQAIGGINSIAMKDRKIDFTTSTIQIISGMNLYMFTDGYMDQFGGPEKKKFNSQKFKKLLIDIHTLDMEKQKEAVELAITEWKGNTRQIDDMLVVGLRF